MDREKVKALIADLNEKQRRRHYFEKNYKDVLRIIDDYNFFHNINNFSKLLYHYTNDRSDNLGKCYICEKTTAFRGFNSGYNKYCSRKCTMSDKKLLKEKTKKAQKTNMERYGVANYTQTEECKEKIKKGNLEKYGVEYFFQSEEYIEKTKKTNLSKYGKEWFLQTKDFKEKTKNTNLEKYGVEHHMKNKKVFDKIKKQTNQKYGVYYFTQSEQYKKKMKEYCISDKFIEDRKKERQRRIEKVYEYYKSYNEKYDLLSIDNDTLTFVCHGCNKTFEIKKNLFYLRNKNNHVCCTLCNDPSIINKSYKESELYDYIKSIYDGDIINNYRDGLEIDIYLPELKIGFEFNGLWFHSDYFKDKDYHLNKTKYFENKDIKVIHIWEDDWDYKKEIIKSMIRYKLNIISTKVYARKCYIKEISNKEANIFLNDNHIQGYVNSSIRLGLIYNNEIVSIATFGKSRNKKNNTELLRFCNKINTTVIGGFSKLFKNFINNYEYNDIITYADITHSDGNLYKINNFDYKGITNLGYYWCYNGVKYNRFNFRKSKLIKEGYDSSKTENEIMKERGYYKVYNCGNYKYSFNLELDNDNR